MDAIINNVASPWCVYGIVFAPAQQQATKPSVYTTLLI